MRDGDGDDVGVSVSVSVPGDASRSSSTSDSDGDDPGISVSVSVAGNALWSSSTRGGDGDDPGVSMSPASLSKHLDLIATARSSSEIVQNRRRQMGQGVSMSKPVGTLSPSYFWNRRWELHARYCTMHSLWKICWQLLQSALFSPVTTMVDDEDEDQMISSPSSNSSKQITQPPSPTDTCFLPPLMSPAAALDNAERQRRDLMFFFLPESKHGCALVGSFPLMV